MQNSFTIRYLRRAQNDLAEIRDFIARDSPHRAAAFVDRFESRTKVLEQFPRSGRVPRDTRLAEKNLRLLVVESYLVFYKIKGATIEVHRVLHGARDYAHLL